MDLSAKGLTIPAPAGGWLVVVIDIDAVGLNVGGQADALAELRREPLWGIFGQANGTKIDEDRGVLCAGHCHL